MVSASSPIAPGVTTPSQLDPRQVPVWQEATHALQQQTAIDRGRLDPRALQARFDRGPPWQQEPRQERFPASAQPPREAAVLIGLQPLTTRDGLQVLLTQRTSHLRSHAGQIAFPGGKIDPQDRDAAATALREAREEVALPGQAAMVLGSLPRYVTGTGFAVTPVVALLDPDLQLQANPGEVEDIFHVPLDFLMDPRNHRKHEWQPSPQLRREWFSMPWTEQDTGRERYIWGATAGMLRDLYRFLAAD